MKFLLVLFVFTMTPEGDFKDYTVVTRPYNSLQECNTAGKYIADNLPASDVKTLSYCVRPDDYYIV